MSLFSHMALLVLAVTLHRATPPPSTVTDERASLTRLVWDARPERGGGAPPGGDRTPAPARRATEIGRDRTTVAVAPRPDPTPQPQPLDADPLPRPTLDAVPFAADHTATRGAVEADRAAPPDSLGPGDGPAAGPGSGDGDGNRRVPGSGPGEFGVGGDVGAPRLVRSVRPEYTADAMRARIQGTVALECVVDAGGRVDQCRVRRSLDPVFGLDQQAIAAARLWNFEPGRRAGQPVAVRVNIELSFTIR